MVQSALGVLTPLVLLKALWHRRYDGPYFADEETEVLGLRNGPKVMQLSMTESEWEPGLAPEPALLSLSRHDLFALAVILGGKEKGLGLPGPGAGT